MIDLVYQYITSSVWEELRYSLRSVQEHFKGEHRIWIVGDKPEWIQNINHIPHLRDNKIQLTNCFDACSKMELVVNHPDITDDFVYMYDDIYLLKDNSREQMEYPLYAVQDLAIIVNRILRTKHQRMKFNTIDLLVPLGLPGMNFENHLPKPINKMLMKETLSRYNCKENRLLFSTLYFNTFFADIPPVMLQKDDEVKAECFGSESNWGYRNMPLKQLDQFLATKRYLSHNDRGLDPVMKKWIENRFPDKSKYER